MMNPRITLTSLITLLTSLVLLPLAVNAQGAISQEVSQNDGIAEGTLVSLVGANPSQVSLADQSNGDYLFGVVTTTGKTLAEIGTEADGQPIATTGDVSVVVSTINGDIIEGDVLGVSSLRGIAARATTAEGVTTIGVALSGFNSASPNAQTVTATTDDGEQNNVTIGTIPVRLAINDFYIDEAATGSILLSVGEQFVGKPVGQLQVVAASAIALSSFVIGGIMMWHAVRGGFVSIGRNPLAGSAVFNGLFYVTLLSIAVIIGGLVAGYVVLLL